ncbi:MAG: type II secretion system F family protein [Chloroflexota bacterium]
MDTTVLIFAISIMVSTFALIMGIRAGRIKRQMSLVSSVLGDDLEAIPTLRQLEMSSSWEVRVLEPMIRRFTGLGQALTPSKNIQSLRQDLVAAGLEERLSIPDFLGIRFLVGAALGLLVFFTASASYPLFSSILFGIAGFVVGLYIPNLWLKSKVSKRKRTLSRELPDVLDMLSICVDAGMGFDAALQKIAYHKDSIMAQEIRRVLIEVQIGVPRMDALRHMADRTDVTDISNFVAVLIQSDSMGISIKDILHTQSVQMRIKRRQRAEESARRAPLKMLFPLVFFIFPALFAMILGPAIPKIMSVF